MTTFKTKQGVTVVELGGPRGALIRVEDKNPYSTDNPAEIAVLERHQGLERSAAATTKTKDDEKDGEDQ